MKKLPKTTDQIVRIETAIAGNILFKDLGEVTRISIRTRDDGVDATRLAGAFGGGGHARAAGASYVGGFPAARDAVLDLARQLLDERSAA